MDSKIIKYTVIIFLISFKVNSIEFSGKFIQGHFIIGKTDPNKKILIDKREIKVSKEELIQLANQRANSIKDVLVTEYKIDEKRVTITTPKITKPKRERWIQSELEIAI